MKQTMSFMVVVLAATHFVTYIAVFVAIGGYTFTQSAGIAGCEAMASELVYLYSVDGVDVSQETERNKATSKYVALPSCAWLLLSFFPFPVRHPLHPLCTMCL